MRNFCGLRSGQKDGTRAPEETGRTGREVRSGGVERDNSPIGEQFPEGFVVDVSLHEDTRTHRQCREEIGVRMFSGVQTFREVQNLGVRVEDSLLFFFSCGELPNNTLTLSHCVFYESGPGLCPLHESVVLDFWSPPYDRGLGTDQRGLVP